ncbi:endoglucanase 5-like [Olea europaea var. sylvestris]|uniref:endoglucanase 5-like n=1 Tax=Olea europaea var. sylvestris TaxID=158386 RepID=UPI000C1D0FD1|nr:endoglucanase 5-like [Olea europaea var. sylvestris]
MGNFWIVNWLAWAATTVSTFDYSDALDKSLLFVEAQRFGKLPINQLIKWCGYFELDDGYSQGVNLAGGYYNAEDHVKFGLPMAYTVTMLSWAAIDFRKEMICGSLLKGPNLRTSPQAPTIIGPALTTTRLGYKLDPEHLGSDRRRNCSCSSDCLPCIQALQLFLLWYSISSCKTISSFANTFRGSYDDAIPSAAKFYTSSGYSDKLLWTAAWLYRATVEEYYLKYVVDNAVSVDT